MHSDLRRRMAAAQLELVRALVGDDVAPAGCDRARLQAMSEALVLKRSRALVRVWPQLARSLGPRFHERFALYARSSNVAPECGPLADGRDFARAVAREGVLDGDAMLEVMAFDLRYSLHCGRVTGRRGLSFCAALLKQPRRMIIAVRVGSIGERWIKLPLKIL